jgi:hypothetical protein
VNIFPIGFPKMPRASKRKNNQANEIGANDNRKKERENF